ncbi:MAG: hypothetical protein Tsb0015_16310 [Simkaniaceae bacterium]
MHYLIDGYNLLFHVFPQTKDFIACQSVLWDKLQELLTSFPSNATVVLDSFEENGRSYPSKAQIENLEIIYSPQQMSADEYILEYLQTHTAINQVVVTSDRALAEKAKRLGAKILTVEDFLNKIRKKRKRKKQEEQKEKAIQKDTKDNIDRLLKIFEKRLKEEE